MRRCSFLDFRLVTASHGSVFFVVGLVVFVHPFGLSAFRTAEFLRAASGNHQVATSQARAHPMRRSVPNAEVVPSPQRKSSRPPESLQKPRYATSGTRGTEPPYLRYLA